MSGSPPMSTNLRYKERPQQPQKERATLEGWPRNSVWPKGLYPVATGLLFSTER
ncbi:hypothetical protein QFZ34_002485 [Phyllobacterium ifriqiyense]|uniref:Uncharacterized protein n=1 Tax=Phyllobacterium ifriqiyense TaxID=314238 RepID=A0ABU0S983_9HYPH|nr:hypothetical protein [Phyllobacterium ifriqiyense]